MRPLDPQARRLTVEWSKRENPASPYSMMESDALKSLAFIQKDSKIATSALRIKAKDHIHLLLPGGEWIRRLDGKPLSADPLAHRAARVVPHAITRATE